MKTTLSFAALLPAGLAALLCSASCGSGDPFSLLPGLFDGPAVYLFQVSAAHDGDFDADNDGNARPELDAMAQSEYSLSYADLGCTYIHAFISVSAASEIRDLGIPEHLPVRGPDGVTIAGSVADLLDGSIGISLLKAGVTTSMYYWTGSTGSGMVSGSACSGWTSGESDWGAAGINTAEDTGWIAGTQFQCNSTRGLLGVCW